MSVHVRDPGALHLRDLATGWTFAQLKAEWRIVFKGRSSAHMTGLGGPTEQDHVVFAAAEGKRSRRKIGNVINVLAEDIDASRCMQHGERAVAIEFQKEITERTQSRQLLLERLLVIAIYLLEEVKQGAIAY